MAENIFCGTIRSAETYSNAGEKILNSEKSPFFSMLVVKIYFSASYWEIRQDMHYRHSIIQFSIHCFSHLHR